MNGFCGFGGGSNCCGGDHGSCGCGCDWMLWILMLTCCCGCNICDILPLILILSCCCGKKDKCDCGCGC